MVTTTCPIYGCHQHVIGSDEGYTDDPTAVAAAECGIDQDSGVFCRR